MHNDQSVFSDKTVCATISAGHNRYAMQGAGFDTRMDPYLLKMK